MKDLPLSWRSRLAVETQSSYYRDLARFVAQERDTHTVFPPADDVYRALELTSYESTAVVLLGQDPYHGEGQAHGLCFSVPTGVVFPPSLRNIFKELQDDLECPAADAGCLEPWARQGVLLLNTVLTVRAHEANSHRGRGWETFTDAIIRAISARSDPVVFVLWGNHAKKKRALIDGRLHHIVESAHPSPLSAHRGFFGSRPFSTINEALRRAGRPEINWVL